MKRFLTIFITMVIIVFIAQSCASMKQITGAASVGKSSIYGESDSWEDPVGFQVGVAAPVKDFNESLSLRCELNFSAQGAAWEESIYGGTLTGKVSLLYVAAPFVLRYQTKSGFFGEAGFQPGILLSAKDKYSGNSYDYKKYVNVFDLGIPIGGGYEFKNNLGIGIRVIPGITNVNKGDDAKDHNLLAVLRATYTFKFK